MFPVFSGCNYPAQITARHFSRPLSWRGQTFCRSVEDSLLVLFLVDHEPHSSQSEHIESQAYESPKLDIEEREDLHKEYVDQDGIFEIIISLKPVFAQAEDPCYHEKARYRREAYLQPVAHGQIRHFQIKE